MAFPASSDPLARALLAAQDTARQLKTYCQGVRDATAAASVSANLLIELYLTLISAKARLQQVAAVPGIAQYAKDQFGNQALDVVAEFNAMVNAIDSAGSWIAANFPSAGGYIQKDQLTAQGVSVRQFTTAQTAGLRMQLDSLISTIS